MSPFNNQAIFLGLSHLSIIFFYTCLSLCFHSISTVGFEYGADRHHWPPTVTLLSKPAAEKSLQFRAGAPFKIALFADLHFGENAWSDWGPIQDVNSIRVMSTLLGYESPGKNHQLRTTHCVSFTFFF